MTYPSHLKILAVGLAALLALACEGPEPPDEPAAAPDVAAEAPPGPSAATAEAREIPAPDVLTRDAAPVAEPEPAPPVRALDVLRVRLAASDWQPGSWIPDLGTEDLPSDVLATGPGASSARLGFLYGSLEAGTSAIDLLEQALRAELLPAEERERAAAQLVTLTLDVLGTLLQLDRCDAAEDRIARAVANALTLGLAERVRQAIEPMQGDLAACQTRRAELAAWNPLLYAARVRQARALCEQATAMPPAEFEPIRGARLQCVYLRQQAAEQLKTALASGAIPPDQAPAAQQELARLQEAVLATLLELDMAATASTELALALDDEGVLPPEAAAQLADVAAALASERQANAEGSGTPLDWTQIEELARTSETMRQSADAIPLPEPTPAEPVAEPEPERERERERDRDRDAPEDPEPDVAPEPERENPFGRTGTLPTE